MARVLWRGSFGKWTDGRGWDRLWFATGRELGTGQGACADGQWILEKWEKCWDVVVCERAKDNDF